MAAPTQTNANAGGMSPITFKDSDGYWFTQLGGLRIYITDTTANGYITAPKGSLNIIINTPSLLINTDAGTTWGAIP